MNDTNVNKPSTQKNIEKLVDEKITNAKLERYEEQLIISKDQLNFFFKIGGAILVVVGLILPIIVTLVNTASVNNAIESMEKRVERLLSLELRKPKLKSILEGKEFGDNSALVFEYKLIEDKKSGRKIRQFMGQENYTINIQNIGNGPAKDLRILLFVEADSLVNWKNPTGDIGWQRWYYSNQPDYPASLTYVIHREAIVFMLDATERIPVNIDYRQFAFSNPKVHKIGAMLNVFFGEPEPFDVPFNIIFKNVESI